MSATHLRIEPEAIGCVDGYIRELPTSINVTDHEPLLRSVRLRGGCRIGSVEYWYHPPSDCVVRADRWADCVEGVEDYAP